MSLLRHEVAPDPRRAADLAEFIGLLGHLRAWAGQPSYRTLARRVGPLLRPARQVSQSTITDVFQLRRRRLDIDLVVGIVRALGVDEPAVAHWRAACVTVHANAKTGGPTGVLRQLPSALPTFTGREEELAWLLGQARPRDPAAALVLTIEGMAGVGKTQLALHAAHKLVGAGRYAEVQLYVNLRGFEPDQEPAAPAAVLDTFLRSLGVPAAQIPDGEDARAAMFRDRMHGLDALILLDNAAGEEQVRSLIPASASCLVLITSRRSLAGLDGSSPRLLDVFSPAEAVELLARIAGHDRVGAEAAVAEEIADACGLLPLAVSLAASRLRARPAWSLADLAARLRAASLDAARAGSRSLRPVFDLSYRELPEPARRLFRLLGRYPGHDLTVPAAAALAGTAPADAEALLELLQDEHLLQQKTSGRYELHDLLRRYAAELADRERDGGRALARLATWSLHTAHNAATAIDATDLPVLTSVPEVPPLDFASRADGLHWLDQERKNLAAVLQASAGAGLHETVWQLAVVQGAFLLLRRHLDDLATCYRLALTAARTLGDPAAEARILAGRAPAADRLDRLGDTQGADPPTDPPTDPAVG
ncbi:NB-ARC domain-containing protein [Kitasatospora viridis]|uniref:Putative ATPase n=1 Tax=Kitasatospora viridis TaxID=281105 RepID=A0A561T647_9ACTN|nr:NB-ARC domain-containing protein [Kitasatospora viridis]TWF82582.1 putative ATPase [Kitasatospora viridis]